MKKILFVFLLFFNFISLYSQNISLKFENDTLLARKTKIIQTSLYIKNNKTEPINGELEIYSLNDDITFIKKIKQNIKLGPQDYIYIPVKAQLKTKTTSTEIVVEANFKEGEHTYSQNLIVVPEKIKNVQFQLKNQHLNFYQVNDSINLDFEISNKGNTDQVVNLVLKYPIGLTRNEFETTELNLKANQDTTLHFQKFVNKQMLKKEDFEIQASLYYKSGDYINSFPIYVNSIKQNRVYRDLNYNDYASHENEIKLSNSYNSSSKQSNYNLALNTNIKLPNNQKIRINSQMEYWDSSEQFFLRNTVVGYQKNRFEGNFGNLYQQGEIMINGIGGEFKYKITDSLNIETGIIDKSYSLLEPFKNSNGYSAWLALNTLKSNNTRSRTFINYDLDYLSGINKYIIYHSQEFIASEKLKLVYQQGLSTISDKEKIATGILAGISSSYEANNWSYFGNQVISSSKYAGMRRGVLQLNERIQYKIKNHILSTNYNYNELNPESFNRLELFFSNQINQNVNIGYRYNHRRFNFYASSNYLYEKRTNSYFNDISLFKKLGLNTTFQINNFNRNLMFSTSFDAGKILNLNLENPYSYRLALGIKYKKLNLSTQYQHNYASINELTNPNQLKQTYKSLSTNLMYSFSLLNNRLEFTSFINYAKNNNLADIVVLNGTVNYEINKSFKAFINSNYNKYLDGLKYSNLNIQAGIIKNFDPNKIHVEKVNLTIQVKYNEKNKTSYVAAKKIVFINNKPFITDENGKVRYKKIPVGNYEIRLQNDNEWLSEPIVVNLKTNSEQEIFYNKTTTISGYLNFEEGKNPYDVVKDKGAYRIEVTNANGKVYKTYTDDSGRYTIYVPEGVYNISLVNHLSNTQTQVIENDIEIVTEVSKPIQQDFIIKINDKKTEVKKFNSVKF